MIPVENAAKGTRILFNHDHNWYVKDDAGAIFACDTKEYAQRHKNKYALVIIEDEQDDLFITNLNPGHITIVVDKDAVGRPNLLTFENTIEWMAYSDIRKKIAKHTNFFCMMASTSYNPYVIKGLEIAKQNGK